MKNRALMALLLVVALIATSTVMAAATDPEVVTTLDELKAALTNGEVEAIRIDGDFTIRENLTINKTVTVAGGSEIFVGEDDGDRFTVEVAANTTVTVEDGAFFGTRWESPESKLVNRGTFLIAAGGEGGVTENYATMTVHGLNQRGLTNHNGATITVDGELSSVQGDREGWIWNQGTITIQTGGILSCVMGTGLVNDATGVLNLNGKLVSAVCFGYEERTPWTEFYNFIRIHENSTISCSDALYYYGHGGDIEGLPQGKDYEETVRDAFGPGLSCTTDRATFLTHQAAGNVYEIAMRTEENDYDYLGGDEITLQLFLCGSAWETASLRLHVPENFEALDATPVGGYIEINNNTGNGSIGSTKIAEYHFRISNAGITEQTMRRFEIEGVSITAGGNNYDNVRFDSDVLFIYPDTCELNGGNAWSAGQSDFGREFIVNNRVEIRADQTWDAPITIRDGGELVINGVEILATADVTIETGGALYIDGFDSDPNEWGDTWPVKGNLLFRKSDSASESDPSPVFINDGQIIIGHGGEEYGELYLMHPAIYRGSGNIVTQDAPVWLVCGYDNSDPENPQLLTSFDGPEGNRPGSDFEERKVMVAYDAESFRFALEDGEISRIVIVGDITLTANGGTPFEGENFYRINSYKDVSVEYGTLTVDANARLEIAGSLEINYDSHIDARAGSEVEVVTTEVNPGEIDYSQGRFVIRSASNSIAGTFVSSQSVEISGGLTIYGDFRSEEKLDVYDDSNVYVDPDASLTIGGEARFDGGSVIHVDGDLEIDTDRRIEFRGESRLLVNNTLNIMAGDFELCDDDTALTIGNEGRVNNYGYFRLNGMLTIPQDAVFNNEGELEICDRGRVDQGGELINTVRLYNFGDYMVHGGAARIINDSGNLYVDDSATWHDMGYNEIRHQDVELEDVIVDNGIQMIFFREGWRDDIQDFVYEPMGNVLAEVKGAEAWGVSLWLGQDYYGNWTRLSREQVNLVVVEPDPENPQNAVDVVPNDDPEDAYNYTIRYQEWGRAAVNVTLTTDVQITQDLTATSGTLFRAALATELPWTYFFNWQEFSENAAVYNYETTVIGDGVVWFICENGFDQDPEIEFTIHSDSLDGERYEYRVRNNEVQEDRWVSELDGQFRDSAVSDFIDFKLVRHNDDVYDDGRRPYDLCIKFSNDFPDEWADIDVRVNGEWRTIHCVRPILQVEDTMTYMEGENHVGSVNVRLRRDPGFSAYTFKLVYDTEKLDLTQVTCNYCEFNTGENYVNEVADGAIIAFLSHANVYPEEDLMFNIKFDVLQEYGQSTDDMEIRVEYYNPNGGSPEDFTNEWDQSINPVMIGGLLQTFRWGDVWRTDRVDVKDAVRLLQFLNGHYNGVDLSEIELLAADVTHDGDVSLADITKLMRYLVGLDATLAQ